MFHPKWLSKLWIFSNELLFCSNFVQLNWVCLKRCGSSRNSMGEPREGHSDGSNRTRQFLSINPCLSYGSTGENPSVPSSCAFTKRTTRLINSQTTQSPPHQTSDAKTISFIRNDSTDWTERSQLHAKCLTKIFIYLKCICSTSQLTK